MPSCRCRLNARDRLIRRSVTTLFGLVVASMAIEALFPPLWPLLLPAVPFLVLFGITWGLVELGHPRVGAWLLISVGITALLGAVIVTGGPGSRFLPYLPLAAIAAGSWLGRRVGLVVLGILNLGIVGSWWLDLPSLMASSELDLLLAHVAAVIIASVFLMGVTLDLKAAAELAWQRALEADQAAATAHAADAARDRFLATVSHELRTPLDTVLGYAEMLIEEERDPDRAQDLDRIRSAGRQLLALVNDVLDMSRVEADELSVVLERIDVGAVIEQVVHTTAPQVADRKNRLRVRIADGLPELHSDPARIRQILLNLVSNAAKYTTDGEIAVEVTTHGHRVRFSVADTGIGIPEEQLPRLFSRFVQLHEGPERRPGIGLGLALSQGLAERLGGRIVATSVAGRGSTFTLELPSRKVC